MKVVIDPASDILYSSYYLHGLFEVFGRRRVAFSSKYFPGFIHDNHVLAFVVIREGHVRKVVIDFTDSGMVDRQALEWCDVYGKINMDFETPAGGKIIPIGPGFGIRIYSLFDTLRIAVINLLKAYPRIPDKRRFLSDYKAQYKRPRLSHYSPAQSDRGYIFFMASLWKKEALTNRYRANFINSSRDNPGITFEGGFAPRVRNDMEGFEAETTSGRISIRDYLQKMKASAIAFNTPAVKKCHGWKLAEYLCLGKAILTTELLRRLPQPLRDGKEALFTTGGKDDITRQSDKILNDPKLRNSLESAARLYFDKHLHPAVVIRKLTQE